MKIALDAMGGDYAPRNAVEGALLAQKDLEGRAQIILVGHQDILRDTLKELGESPDSLPIVHAESVIGMDEHPTKAVARKQDSSIVTGYGMMMKGMADCFCGAGNTGAMVVGAMFTIKAIEGVMRPCIAGYMPKTNGEFGIVVDVGATTDCKPDVLAQFAEMGSVYVETVFNKKNPKVGLLSVGEEEEKGSLVIKEAHQLLKTNEELNFIGNIEGRDLFTDAVDLIVCDGMVGNVILKMGESLYPATNKRGLKDDFLDLFNYETVGGSPILGLNGNVVIGHGSSTPKAIKGMLKLGADMTAANFVGKIQESFAQKK